MSHLTINKMYSDTTVKKTILRNACDFHKNVVGIVRLVLPHCFIFYLLSLHFIIFTDHIQISNLNSNSTNQVSSHSNLYSYIKH